MRLSNPVCIIAAAINSSNGLDKTRHTNSYLDDGHAWGFRLYDLAAIAAWRIDAMDLAVKWGTEALELDPTNQRLKDNLHFFINRRDERPSPRTPNS